MATDLYLDTARFGLTAPRARQAHADFLRLGAEEGGSFRVDAFLRRGADAWPAQMRSHYPGLADWHGLAGLKESLGAFAGCAAGTPVLLANRSAQLMKLAARALFRRCRSVLHTDLEWPGYLAILEEERRGSRGRLVCLPARDAVLRHRLEEAEFVRTVAVAYRRQACEGLFLSAVSFEGIRLPVAEIVAALRHACPPRFVVVDGAQALAHLPPGLPACDVYLAGCHKWLGAGQPLGLAFHPRPGSHGFLQAVADRMIARRDLDDPLLLFTSQLATDRLEHFGETVSLAGLFACAAAVAAELASPDGAFRPLPLRLANAGSLAEVAQGSGWDPLLPGAHLRSGILLLRARRPAVRATPAEELRAGFQRHGVAVTTYTDGLARLSLPARPWKPRELDRLRSTLQSLAC
jgi:hypothetical protein